MSGTTPSPPSANNCSAAHSHHADDGTATTNLEKGELLSGGEPGLLQSYARRAARPRLLQSYSCVLRRFPEGTTAAAPSSPLPRPGGLAVASGATATIARELRFLPRHSLLLSVAEAGALLPFVVTGVARCFRGAGCETTFIALRAFALGSCCSWSRASSFRFTFCRTASS